MLKKLWIKLVRFGFRLLYNELAWTYDVVSWLVSLGAWREWQRAALPFVTGKRVLEVGHGPGHMLLELKASGYQAVGLDLSPYMGRLARRWAQQAETAVSLVRGEVQALPFAAASFDTVLATFPTEYIVDPAALASIYGVLGENGRLVIVPEGHLTGEGPLYRFIKWLFTVTGQRSGPFAVDEENRWPAAALWQPYKEKFLEAGFQVEIEQFKRPGSGGTVIVAHKMVGHTRNAVALNDEPLVQ